VVKTKVAHLKMKTNNFGGQKEAFLYFLFLQMKEKIPAAALETFVTYKLIRFGYWWVH
jgi:hypothetical protein